MASLWTFGDSHTAGHGALPGFEYYEQYKKDGDRIWPEYVANHFNLKLENKATNGCSNDTIINQIIDNWEQIQPNDVVIIGQTYSHRFDIPRISNKEWITFVPFNTDWTLHMFNSDPNAIELDMNDIDNLNTHLLKWRYDSLYNKQYYKIFNHYANILKKQNILVVLWHVESDDLRICEKIIDATNDKIDDRHLSFLGHLQFANNMVKNVTFYQKNGLYSIKKSIM